MKLLSMIVPCYNEELNIELFYNEVIKLDSFFKEKKLDIEIIYIDDGSKDDTAKNVRGLHIRDSRVSLISFSRNFGKEAALFAGFEHSKGDYIVAMDVDLQDPPAMLPEMYSYIENEYDSVATRRVNRKGEPVIRSFFARCFYKLMNKISNADMVDGARDYRLMTRQFVDAILSMGEYNRFSKGIFGWVGFKTKWLEYENVERVAGETKWSFWSLFRYSLEGIVAFSTAPLAIASYSGILFCFAAIAFIIFIVIRKSIYGDPVDGWASQVCIMLFVGGVQLFCMGIIGQYLSKLYMEAKKRPIYIIKDKI